MVRETEGVVGAGTVGEVLTSRVTFRGGPGTTPTVLVRRVGVGGVGGVCRPVVPCRQEGTGEPVPGSRGASEVGGRRQDFVSKGTEVETF